MILPFKFSSLKESLRAGSEIYHILKTDIGQKYGKQNTSVGDEGGFAPNIQNSDEALELLMNSIVKSGYENKVGICLDIAASEFYNSETKMYNLDFKNPD